MSINLSESENVREKMVGIQKDFLGGFATFFYDLKLQHGIIENPSSPIIV